MVEAQRVGLENVVADRSVHAWNAVSLIRDEAHVRIGQDIPSPVGFPDILSSSTIELLEGLEISPAIAASLIDAHLTIEPETRTWKASENQSVVRQYQEYLGHYSSDHELEAAVRGAFQRRTEPEDFFSGNEHYFNFLQERSPIGGTSALLLYDYAVNNLKDPDYQSFLATASKDSRPFSVWYKEFLESSFITAAAINQFFQGITNRAESKVEKGLVTDFLNSLESDVLHNVVEIVTLAGAMGIHVPEAGSGMFVSNLPVRVRRDEFSVIQQELLSLWGEKPSEGEEKNLLWEKSPELFEINSSLTSQDGVLFVPTYLSTEDLQDFFQMYQRIWTQIRGGLRDNKAYHSDPSQDSYGGSVISLGNAIQLMLRPQEFYDARGGRHQARVSIGGRVGAASQFNLRVDREVDRRTGGARLSTDIGTLSTAQILNYARKMLDKDASRRLEEKEEGVVSETLLPRIRNIDPTLSDGNVAALVIANAMKASNGAGMRNEDFFQYHAGGAVAANDEFCSRFPEIVRGIQKMLARKLSHR